MDKRTLHLPSKTLHILFILLLSAIGMTKGYAVTIGNLNYSLNNTNMTATVTGHKNGTSATGNLIIPSSVTYGGQTYSVTTIGYGAFWDCSGFTGNLILPNSVTTIGGSAFRNCSGFTGNLTIPNSVTSIGNGAFYDCSGFTGSLTIPNSVTTIDGHAFSGCSGFSGSLTIPNSVTTIGDEAFYHCNGFSGSLIIGNSVTSIGRSAFKYCSGFVQVKYNATNCADIPHYVYDEYHPFYGCVGTLIIGTNVERIPNRMFFGGCFYGFLSIPNSVISIGDYTFDNCSGFTGSLTIPNSVTSIGYNPFSGCTGLEQIIVASNNPIYDSRDNCNAIIETSTNTLISGCKNAIIPNTVTAINPSAFLNCNSLTGNLVIPNSVTLIGSDAFRNCSGLTGSLTIPNSVTTIGNQAFMYCSGFNGNLTIPNSVTTIGSNAFTGCSGFTGNLTIGNSVTTIGSYAFIGCRGFTGNLTIGNSVTSIGISAFIDCSNFTSMTVLSETPPTLGDGVFDNVPKTIPVYVLCGYEEEYASQLWGGFYDFIGFCGGSVTVMAEPEECGTVTGDGQFEANQLCTVTATANEGYAFANWTFNGTVVSVEAEYAFYVTGNMTLVAHFVQDGNIVFADANVKSICIANWDTNGDGELSYAEAAAITGLGQVFSRNAEITSFEELQYFIGLTTIGTYAFEHCSGLMGDLTIPNFVTTIGVGAFAGCSGFTGSLTIPNSVTTIAQSAFQQCSGLTGDLTIPNSVTTIGSQAFYGCSGFTGSLTIPNSVTTIAQSAFLQCSGLTGDLTIPNSVTTIGQQAFSGCSGFTGSLTIPNSVTTIGALAFQNCRFTGRLVIPNSITTIESATFNLCWNFTSVEIPETVTFIRERAFACWYSLQSITVLAVNPPVLDNDAFVNVSKTIPVYVPCGSLSAYQNAEGWNEFTNIQEACDMFTVTATANPTVGGSVSGGGTYQSGQTCTLTATANDGYNFVNWTENGQIVSTNATYSFTVTGDRSVVANFALSGTITNHWTPEGSSYSEIMAMYSVIQIDGVEQYSNTLEVGVFCGDECRGSAIASEFNLTHRYLAILNVFGENGHQLTFKLYDHSIGQELDLTPPAAVSFDFNGYGNPVEPYVLNFTSSITHTQALNSGWNWWSTYIEQDGIDGLGMLENSIGSAGVRIQGRNGTIDQFEYQGSSYWYGSLSSIENEQMYKIRTNAACNAMMVGHAALPANHPININGGWNWIGFPCNQSVSVNDAMSGFTPVANDVIKGRNGSTTYVSYGSTSLWYGTLNTLEPGQGYMYKSNSNTSKTLIFQTGRGEETVTNVTEGNSFFTLNTDDFSDNMLVTAVIDLDGQELRSEDYEVAAYVGNECRGSVRLMYVEPFDRYVAFLLVFGEAEEEIHFVLTDGNDVVLSDDFLTYTADDLEGTVTEPAILHFGTLGLNDNEHDFVNIFPNPSNGIFNIEGNGLRKIEVVNAFGQTVLLREVENNLMQIDLGDKAAGVYLLRVITNNGITTKQLIKE